MRKDLLPGLVLKITCLIIVVVLLRQFYLDIKHFPDLFGDLSLYESWGISEWLINYQGGFVRRGLAGELLFQAYKIHPYPVPYVIIGINIICLICLTYCCIVLFRRMNWPLWMLLFPMFLYYRLYGVEMGLLNSRRDALMLLLAYWLFCQYKKYIDGGPITPLWFISILIILLHEGMIFSIFPFLILHTIVNIKGSIIDSIKKSFFLWWPVAVALLVVIVCHGNELTPFHIWQSWTPCFQDYPFSERMPKIGVAVECMTYSLAYNHHIAFSTTWQSDFGGGLPCWPFNLYLLIAFYYLFTRMDTMRCGCDSLGESRIQMSNIFLIQLFFIMPMLGFVADDWYRSVPYCCVTSSFLCYLFPIRTQIPVLVNNFSEFIQRKMDKSSFLCNPWSYFLILISLPFCTLYARIGGMFPFIPLDLKSRLLEMIIG